MARREHVAAALTDCVARLDTVVQPYGFVFDTDEIHASHTGPFASGHYVRNDTRIGLSCRDTIDNVVYEHSFVTQNLSWREIERFSTSHSGLMSFLGHADDARLICADSIPDAVLARDGADRVDALIHDLSMFVLPLIANDMDIFFAAIRKGYRSYSIV